MKAKLLEVVIGGKPYIWVADKDTKIDINDKLATINSKHEKYGKLTTEIDLHKAEIVSIG